VDAAKRKTLNGANEGRGGGFEARFLAGTVEGADRNKTGEITPEVGNFIVDPEEKIAAIAPDKSCPKHEQKVADKSQQTE